MTQSQPRVIVAHQLGGEFEQKLRPRLPAGIELVRLDRERAWELPSAARILIAVPPRGGNVVLPDAQPAAWPGALEWIQTVSVGVDEFPNWVFSGTNVTCGRGLNASPIAEFVLASLLAVAKRFPRSWVVGPEQWENVVQDDLRGKTLGILGLGSIGTAIANLGLAFGMDVIAHRRRPGPATIDQVRLLGLERVLQESDHLVVALPLTDQTRQLLNARTLGLVKPGVHLVNISRGGVIDHEALLAGLEQGRVGFASLDVTDPEPLPPLHPLYTHPRVHISPHISYGGTPSLDKFIVLFLDNLNRFLSGAPLLNQVDPVRGY